MVSRMESKVKAEDIPEWDGRHSAAIQWISDVQEIASVGGYVPYQMGQHLWLRLKEGSPARAWYYSLPLSWKTWMKRYHLNFLSMVKTHLLGDRWLEGRNAEYATQRFRQEGHQRETPLEFIQRRILYTRMLIPLRTVGGPEEVRLVMERAPSVWKTILVIESVPSVVELQTRLSDLESQLIDAVRGPSAVSRDALVGALRELGVGSLVRRDNSASASRFVPRNPHVGDSLEEAIEDAPSEESPYFISSAEDPVVAQAYAVAAKKQRPPPKGGYPFPKRDDRKKSCYADAKDRSSHTRRSRRPSIEEVEDESFTSTMPTAERYLIEANEDTTSSHLRDSSTTEGERMPESDLKFARYAKGTDSGPPHQTACPPPPPKPETVRWIAPRRRTEGGRSALGVSVVSMRGRLGSPDGEDTDLRLDSGADITLLSSEYYHAMKQRPPLKRGAKLKLCQLTEDGTELEGYVQLPVYVPTETGDIIAMMAEAYIVPGMSVPVLLGEDFHLTYELTVERSVDFGTRVHVGRSQDCVLATGVRKTRDATRVRKSAGAEAYFVRSKIHRRNKAKRRSLREASRREALMIIASRDTKIKPHSCANIEVHGDWQKGGEWFVDKQLLGGNGGTHFAVPNLLLSSESKRIPISNLTSQPRIVKKGALIASVARAEEYLDKPRNRKDL
ncbi:hypothetical protein BC629DRAFT_1301793, partial [Irpex lacteus]